MSSDPTSVFQLSMPTELRERPPVLFIRVDPFEQPYPVELLPSLLECLSFPICFPGLITEKGRRNERESQHCSLRTTNMHRAPLQYLEIRYPWVPSIGVSRSWLVEPILLHCKKNDKTKQKCSPTRMLCTPLDTWVRLEICSGCFP